MFGARSQSTEAYYMRRSLSLLTVLVVAFALLPTVAVADGHGACGDSYTPIYEIHGDGSSSPLVGDTIVTEGIVTVDVQKEEEHDGFFIQDAYGDGDASTSDGIYVRHKDFYAVGR
jgi:predicted extracellular nuclease